MSERWLDWIRDPSPWKRPDPLPGPIETERLVVRLYEKGDGPGLFSAISASREALLPWMAWAREDHRGEDDSIYYVERVRRAAARSSCNDFPMVVIERTSGEVLGGTGLHDIDRGLLTAEIGYWVRGDRHAKGVCTEAVGALISAALKPVAAGGWGLRRIFIQNALDNIASRRVCQKLGLRLEGRVRQGRYLGPEGVDGAPGYTDMVLFGVLENEWDFDAHRAKAGIDWGPGLDL